MHVVPLLYLPSPAHPTPSLRTPHPSAGGQTEGGGRYGVPADYGVEEMAQSSVRA